MVISAEADMTMGPQKSRKTFWGEDEQRRERAFRACTETSDTELARTREWLPKQTE